jgi:hypothetical protein
MQQNVNSKGNMVNAIHEKCELKWSITIPLQLNIYELVMVRLELELNEIRKYQYFISFFKKIISLNGITHKH